MPALALFVVQMYWKRVRPNAMRCREKRLIQRVIYFAVETNPQATIELFANSAYFWSICRCAEWRCQVHGMRVTIQRGSCGTTWHCTAGTEEASSETNRELFFPCGIVRSVQSLWVAIRRVFQRSEAVSSSVNSKMCSICSSVNCSTLVSE